MTVEEVENIVGADTTQRLAETTIAIYQIAQELALDKGIIIADTKLEFGFIDGELTLIDELLNTRLEPLLGHGGLRTRKDPAKLR